MRKNKFVIMALAGIILLVIAGQSGYAANEWTGQDSSYINAYDFQWSQTISSTLDIPMNEGGS